MAIVNNAHVSFSGERSALGVIGTLGTSDVGGTALTLAIAVDGTTGAQWQREIGTPNVILSGGTFQSGTIGNINSIGTVGTLQLGSVQVIGGTLNAGTFSNAGTNVNVVTGTINVGTATTNMATGTLNVGTVTATLTSNGTLTALGLGTVTGVTANAGSYTGNPVGIGGTDAGGTIRTVLVNSAGAMSVSGASAGTFNNIVTGSLVGTILGGTVQNLATGTLNALASGTITTGTVSVTTGTIVGPVASGGSETGAPVPIGGTDSGGTVRLPLVTSGGLLSIVEVPKGTITNVSTGTINALASGTISGGTIQNLNAGTVTVVALGTVTGVTANAGSYTGNPVGIGGTDSGGTIRLPLVTSGGILAANVNTGTINVGTFTNLGTNVNLVTGTITTGSITDIAKLYTGTITAGTLTNLVSGTINALVAGTITNGTLGNLNYGTVNIDPTPIPVRTLITTYGTTGTTGAAVFGTLVAGVGAGTKVYISGYQIIGISGTAESSIIIGTFTQAAPAGGTNMVTRTNAVPGGGVARDRAIPFVTGTNGTICFWMSGAGTVYFQVDYWAAT